MVRMVRMLVVVVAIVWSAALGVSGALAQMKIDGTIRSAFGNVVTLEDGTQLSIPSTMLVAREQLRPGVRITVEYVERAGQKVATAIEVKG